MDSTPREEAGAPEKKAGSRLAAACGPALLLFCGLLGLLALVLGIAGCGLRTIVGASLGGLLSTVNVLLLRALALRMAGNREALRGLLLWVVKLGLLGLLIYLCLSHAGLSPWGLSLGFGVGVAALLPPCVRPIRLPCLEGEADLSEPADE